MAAAQPATTSSCTTGDELEHREQMARPRRSPPAQGVRFDPCAAHSFDAASAIRVNEIRAYRSFIRISNSIAKLPHATRTHRTLDGARRLWRVAMNCAILGTGTVLHGASVRAVCRAGWRVFGTDGLESRRTSD